MVGLPSTILSVTNQVTGNFVSQVFGPVANAVSTPLWIAVTLFIVLYGYLVMSGQIQHLYQTAFKNIFLIGFVTYTALNWDWFSYLYNLFSQGAGTFSSALSQGQSPTTALDDLYNRGMDTAFAIWTKSGFDLALWGLGAVVFIVTLWLTAFSVFLLLLAQALIAVTLALGPIFISFFLFRSTRQWFKNWISSLVGLVIFQLIVYATLGLGYAIYQAVVPTGELYTAGSLDTTQLQGGVLPLLLIFTALLFVLRRADGHAHALVGSMGYVGDATGQMIYSVRNAMNTLSRRGPRLSLRSNRGRSRN